jgi:hypothetical protein
MMPEDRRSTVTRKKRKNARLYLLVGSLVLSCVLAPRARWTWSTRSGGGTATTVAFILTPSPGLERIFHQPNSYLTVKLLFFRDRTPRPEFGLSLGPRHNFKQTTARCPIRKVTQFETCTQHPKIKGEKIVMILLAGFDCRQVMYLFETRAQY